MKNRFILILLCALPLISFAQNYEQQGDELFAQAQYDKAAKKYRAAIELSGTSAVLNEKLSSADQCKSLLSQANIAEEASDYASAHKYYSQLYAIHPLPSYKNKISSYKSKASTAQVPTKKSHSYSVDERREVLKRIQSKINNIGFITGIWDGDGGPRSALFHDFYRSRNNNRNETFSLDVVFCQDGSFQLNIFTRDYSTHIIKKMIVDDQLFVEHVGTINDPVYRYATYPAGTSEDKIANDANYVLRKLLQYRNAHL